ncbi:polyprenyl synthetase family protein [Sphaerisporangium sp. B11E5]|uniref:polyprenyl synthetase family protein n=1 Tax=Sphaerisporangium sp. B11E5 TaxID=3153563 RepID=UPI00325F57FF
MLTTLTARFEASLTEIDRLALAEVTRWPWEDLPPMEKMLCTQLARPGKRLRPLLMLATAGLPAEGLPCLYPAAVAVELFHLASLILDDIQDNAELRRGERAVHTTSGTSMAINLAGLLRTLSYHPVHRAENLPASDRLKIHRLLDTAATRLFMGQTIDIGWDLGWYPEPARFPYESMIAHKTGGLFGCAARIGAFLAGRDEHAAEGFGARAGALYQMSDDYDDVFAGDPERSEDLREGKYTWPLIELRSRLQRTAPATAAEVTRWLREGTHQREIVDLMRDHGVDTGLRRRLDEMAHHLVIEARELTAGQDGRTSPSPSPLEMFARVIAGSATRSGGQSAVPTIGVAP